MKAEAIQRYLVSDGKHTVQAQLRFAALPGQFVRLSKSTAPTTRLGSTFSGLIPVKSTNLWAETNVDMDPNAIRFGVENEGKQSPFKLLNADGRIQSVNSFTQLVSL